MCASVCFLNSLFSRTCGMARAARDKNKAIVNACLLTTLKNIMAFFTSSKCLRSSMSGRSSVPASHAQR